MVTAVLWLVLALLVPVPEGPAGATAVPAPTPPSVPHTIVTVKSSPFCNSLAQHFNGAFTPMLANDRTLDRVGVQLDDINTLFTTPDYVNRFIDARLKMEKYVTSLEDSLPKIQQEIDALRKGATLTSDAAAAAAIQDAAAKLQKAYAKQRAMAVDLHGIVQGMIDYDIANQPHVPGGTTAADAQMPAEMRDMKSYLRFDGQRDVIAQAENAAVDTALDTATTVCASTK